MEDENEIATETPAEAVQALSGDVLVLYHDSITRLEALEAQEANFISRFAEHEAMSEDIRDRVEKLEGAVKKGPEEAVQQGEEIATNAENAADQSVGAAELPEAAPEVKEALNNVVRRFRRL